MRKQTMIAVLALSIVTVPASAECPGGTVEIIAMVVSGGVYCLFDSARDMLNDFKTELNQIRSQGEAALNSLSAKYANDTIIQAAQAKNKIDRIQRELRELIERGKQCSEAKGRNDAAKTTAASKSASESSRPGPQAPPNKPVKNLPSQSMGTGAVGPAQSALNEALRQHEEVRNGTFAQAGAQLDKLGADVRRELNQGFQTSLFGPITQIVAGFPPPDPATLVVFFAATRIKLAQVRQDNTNMIKDVTSRYNDKLAGQQLVLDDVIAKLQADLDRARKIGIAMDAYCAAATPTNKAQLDAAVSLPVPSKGPSRGVTGAGSTHVNSTSLAKSTAAAEPPALAAAWTRVEAFTKRPMPAKWSPPQATQMTQVARADLRKRLAGPDKAAALAALENEARTRIKDPATRDKVIAWIRNEGAGH
jgi:hypothetical protein